MSLDKMVEGSGHGMAIEHNSCYASSVLESQTKAMMVTGRASDFRSEKSLS